MQGRVSVHIGLNAHLLSHQTGYRRGGIHNYIHLLIQHLPAIDPTLKFTIFTGSAQKGIHQSQNSLNWKYSRLQTERPWVRIAWEQLLQPWALLRADVQLLHTLAFVSPLVAVVPNVITVHDLSFLRYPERFRPANRLYLSLMTRVSCQRARRIIAVSHATANEVVHWLHVPVERVDVVPHGVQLERFCRLPQSQVEEFRREKGLPERFVLFLGTLEPRKNLVTLIEAFSQTHAVRQGIKLILAGGKGWYFHEIFGRVEALNLKEAVCFPGFVPDAELPLWYNAATVFVYPSLYEGFGLPLLEAMACGTPVIGSAASCLPEVVGDAGPLIAPYDVAGLAENLDRLLADDDLCVEMGTRGQKRAAGFTWEATAAATASSYRRALDASRDIAGSVKEAQD